MRSTKQLLRPPPPLEFDARLKAAVESPKRVLFANLLLNPFGPTLVYVFVLKSDAQSGRTANLYQAALHRKIRGSP